MTELKKKPVSKPISPETHKAKRIKEILDYVNASVEAKQPVDKPLFKELGTLI